MSPGVLDLEIIPPGGRLQTIREYLLNAFFLMWETGETPAPDRSPEWQLPVYEAMWKAGLVNRISDAGGVNGYDYDTADRLLVQAFSLLRWP
jgi:hypothetical protein